MFRAFTALILSLLLAAASVTMAMARVQSAGQSEMMICAGEGMAVVTLDARGQPVEGTPGGAIHLCPDCLAGHPAALLPEQPVPAAHAPLPRQMRASVCLAPVAAGLPPSALARGPPVPV